MIIPSSIEQIFKDNVSGSVTLLKRLTVALENLLLDTELDPATFIAYVEHIRQKMGVFTVIRHFCDELILSHNVSVQQFPGNYLDFIREYKDFWEHAPRFLLNNLLKKVNLQKKTVMLHSNSDTIKEVFRLYSEKDKSVHFIQTVSAPAEEGRIQGHDLALMGFKVTLVADALTASMLKRTHLLILGADQVRKSTIINKVGTLQMVLAAQEFNVPVFVLTESRKIAKYDSGEEFKDQPRDKTEILRDIVHPNLTAENFYFEEIPKYMLSGIITEKEIIDNKR